MLTRYTCTPETMIGRQIGQLTVESYYGIKTKMRHYNCICNCGSKVIVNGRNLRKAKPTSSCRPCHYKSISKHGMWKSNEFKSWTSMRRRCLDPRVKEYKYYGERGISICERWMEFKNFYEDMGNKPTPTHALDRINNDGNYEPGNCRWVTIAENNRNKRPRRSKKFMEST